MEIQERRLAGLFFNFPGILPGFFAVTVVVALLLGIQRPYMALSTISYAVLVCGMIFRKHSHWHALMMGSGVLLDLTIVVILQSTREAIETATGGALTPFQLTHVISSFFSVMSYFPLVILGLWIFVRDRRDPGRRAWAKWHRRVGVFALFFRTLGFVLMFSMLWKIS